MNFPAKYFLLLIISTLSLSISAQYDCNCGNVTLTNLTKNPSGPGCSVIAQGVITATQSTCVNNNWTWNTTPIGSSGSVYVGFSQNGVVPFSQPYTLNFYIPMSCESLGSAFINFYPPNGGSCDPVPLPVVYTEIYQDKNELVWITNSEINNSHFVIEGSVDGLKWNVVSSVDSKFSNSRTDTKYSIIIKDKYIQYLRIVQVDLDGKIDISAIIKWRQTDIVSNSVKQITISSGDDVHFPDFTLPENAKVNIIDFSGRIIYSGNQIIDVPLNLNTGQYFVGYFDEQTGFTLLAKLVVI